MIWWHLVQLFQTEAVTATPCLCLQSHQIEQLKEEIGAKDLALVKEHFDHMKVRGPAESVTFVQPKKGLAAGGRTCCVCLFRHYALAALALGALIQ